MRSIAIFGTIGVVAALVSGCALDTGESGPAPISEQTEKEEQAFDASIFKFTTWVKDDGQGISGGWQRATAPLGFRDTRGSFLGKGWTCVTSVQLPIRLNQVVISFDTAAELTAEVADAAGSFVLHSQPSWPIAVLFCKRFAEKMEQIFAKVPGGPYGARVTSR